MVTVIFGATTIICGVGWLAQRISTMTLLWYLQEKNCPFPSDEDMKRGSRYVVDHMMRDLFKSRRK